MIIALVLCLALIVVLSIICSNLINQNKQLEEEIGTDYEFTEMSEQKVLAIYEYILRKLISCKQEMDRIDKRGSFSSDDEVGFSFKVIQNSIDLIVSELQSIKTPTEEKP